jgi:ABC-type polysaccharide/polyol phosphate export permease
VTDYFTRIWQLRHFWLALVRIDLQRRYRHSIIGIGWSLLNPIAMTIVFCAFFCTLMKQDVRTYAPYVLTGMTFWGFITGVVLQGCQCFFQGECYIRQQPAPLAIYPLRTLLGAGFHFLLGLGIAVALTWCVHGFANLPILLMTLAPTLALLFVLGWSLAICMGVSNVLFQDSQHLIEVVLQVVFYLTPIFYFPKTLGDSCAAQWIIAFNPFAAMLDLIRAPLLDGQLPSLWSVSLASFTAFAAVSAATLALARFEKRMIFYL